jgi:hypothetical protein
MWNASLGDVATDVFRVLGVWVILDRRELKAMRPAILDRAVMPAFEVDLLRSFGDTIVVRVVGKEIPSRVRAAFYYVEGRGTFRLLRREDWPALSAEELSRTIMTMSACSA